ncbi:MAG: tetratricopeptide repeat protein [Vicinamibacterales bacterium]
MNTDASAPQPNLPEEPERPPSAADVRREFLRLALLAAVAVAVFFGTRTVAESTRRTRTADAHAWFTEGQQALAGGHRDDAIARMRQAVVLDPERADYRLALAESLSAAHRDADARGVLSALRERDPEDPDVNLQLARISARAGEVDEAGRYYQHALSALWSERDADRRRAVRFELIDYLLAQGRNGRALSELLVLNADAPTGVPDQIRMGRLLLAAGDPRRAADRFDAVLKLEPEEPEAVAGAGLAAFALGDYPRTLRLLNRASDSVAGVADARAIARFVLDRDPLAARLGRLERTRRVRTTAAEMLAEATMCLDRLPPASQAASVLSVRIDALTSIVEPDPRLHRSATLDRDEVEEGLAQLVETVRTLQAARCGPPTTLDRAVELMAARHALDAA